MGLDMYLYRRRADEPPVEEYLDADDVAFDSETGSFDLDAWRAYKEKVEVAYWRKANQIHAWFVNTVQGGVDECQFSDPFGREVLAGLVERCKRVLAGESAEDLLPTQGGFFFGGTDYDEYYEHDLRATIKMLEPLLAERDGDLFVYHSSW